jgi:hypothetical protein
MGIKKDHIIAVATWKRLDNAEAMLTCDLKKYDVGATLKHIHAAKELLEKLCDDLAAKR